MGKKEYLQKELDLILEKLRFWRYIVFGIISATVGVFYKGDISYRVIILLITGVIGLFIAVLRISSLTKKYNELLLDLKDTE